MPTRFITSNWKYMAHEPERTIQLSVVVNFDLLNDYVVASAVGPDVAASLGGKLQREPYVNGNGNKSTRYRVMLNNGTALDWDRTRKDALDRFGSEAIHKALGR